MMTRRLGLFHIDSKIIIEHPDDVAAAFAAFRFVPLRVDRQMHRNTFEFMGFSQYFPEIDEGSEVPHYQIISHTEAGKVVKVEIQGVGKFTFPAFSVHADIVFIPAGEEEIAPF
jgi:hypothetical protein